MVPRIVYLTLFAVLSSTASGVGQTLTVDGASARTVRLGQDFATTAYGDPWDFSQPSDYLFMLSDGWGGAVPTVANGKLSGQVSAADVAFPALMLQFEGSIGHLNLVGRTGVASPIDANTYRRLSFRMRRAPETSSPLDTFDATWFFDIPRTTSTIGARLALTRGFDDLNKRYPNQSPIALQSAAQYHIYKIDLDGAGWGFAPNWAGNVLGLQLGLGEGSLNPGGLGGSTIDVDWVRLTSRGTHTAQLAWSGFGGRITLTATNGVDTIQIFPDDGTPTADFAAAASLTWDYGFLPPGTWTVSASDGLSSRSISLVIDPAPIIYLTEPDASGGRDWATTEFGDAWDLTNPEDIERHGLLNNVGNATFAGDGLTAINAATGPLGSPTASDPAVYLLGDPFEPPGPTVDAATYRHLTFTIDHDREGLSLSEALGPFGGLLTLVWGQRGTGQLSQTQGFFPTDGLPTTYSVDLAAFTRFGSNSSCVDCYLQTEGGTDLWQGRIETLRIDPFIPTVTRSFRLANIKLAADDESNGNGLFAIRWNATDASFTAAARPEESTAASNATVTLSYDTDTAPASGLVQIASGILASDGQFLWKVAGVPAGRYFIHAQITDTTGNTQARYSTGPVRIASVVSAFVDGAGDGMADDWEAAFGVSDPKGDDDMDGVTNLVEFESATDPTVPNTWILPEGATGFFRERIAVANPGTEPADLVVTYLREGAAPIVRDYSVAGMARLTIDVNTVAGLANGAVSAVVTVTRGAVVVERTMSWDDRTGALYGGHTGKGLSRPGTEWFLAEGDAAFFETSILLANANGVPAAVNLEYLLTNGTVVSHALTVDANSRFTIFTNAVSGLAGQAFSTRVTSNVPITVERAMYFGSGVRLFNGGHEAAAVPAASTSWFVAEGTTAGFFDMFLLLANPGATPVTATLDYLKPDGSVIVQTVPLAATSRTTIAVDAIAGLEDTDVSAAITATGPIVVERSMFWPTPFTSWYESHNSAGVTDTGTRLVLAEGELGGPLDFQTFILFANPTVTDATVTMTFLRTTGAPIAHTFTVPAQSRVTRSTGEFALQNERFGVLVTSSVPIALERAMYWNALGEIFSAGTNETAVKLR